MYTPRPYQLEQIDEVRAAMRRGARCVLMQGATGSGKTVSACAIIDGAMQKGSRVLFLAHRRELVRQCSSKLTENGVEHGIIMSGDDAQDWHPVQVASIQTLYARAMQRDVMLMPRANIIVIDEAHRSLAATYRKIINRYEKAVVIGLTATPCRGDGKGLGHVYHDLVCGPPMRWLIDNGYLVPLRYFAPYIPDMKGVQTGANGDYVEKQSAERMDKPKLVGDIVEQWLKIAPERQTIVFATSVAHSIHIKESFEAANIRVAHIDASTPGDERDDILGRFARKEIQVICNVMILTEGYDNPSASCCVLARPTKSLGLYLQMVGRPMRPFYGKKDGIVIDHAGCVHAHGPADEITEWSLDEEGKVQDREAKKRDPKDPIPITCEQCFCVYERRHNCPSCGHINAKRGRYVETETGELFELKGRKSKKKTFTKEQKQLWYSMFLGYSRHKGYRDGWAAHKYREKVGVWPRGLMDIETPPNKECQAFIRHLNIKAAKSREKERKSA